MIGLRASDEYPELPLGFTAGKGAAGAKKIGNVWRKWRGSTQDELDTAFEEDTKSEKIFNPTKFIKDETRLKYELNILSTSFNVI